MPLENTIRIREFDGSGFEESNTHSATIGEYREEKVLWPDFKISVNTVNQPDTFALSETDPPMAIAAVRSNKTGGNSMVNLHTEK